MELALTLDYELYGNGHGDVVKDIIKPTDRLLAICRQFNIKITIFFEIVEYWKLKETYEAGNNMGYLDNPADIMTAQIKKAYQEGHDIQLHIHPQWLDAEYSNGRWYVSKKLWRLSELPEKRENHSSYGMVELFSKGKRTLEEIIQSLDLNYRCRILRAGGLNVFPSKKIVSAMRKTGLKADSSVFAGGFSKTDAATYDFREIPNDIPSWHILNDDLTDFNQKKPKTSDVPIFEFPIFALPVRRFRKYDIVRIKNKIVNKSARETTIVQAKSRVPQKNRIKYFLEKESVPWDFCLFSKSKHRLFCKQLAAINKGKEINGCFTLIGHSKEFRSPEKFVKMLSFIFDKYKNIKFITLTEALQRRISMHKPS